MYSLIILVLMSTAVTVFGEVCNPGTCKSDDTCCSTGISGGFNCCPLENAVCCEDGIHCCPQGTECDIATGLCRSDTSEDGELRILDKLENRRGAIDEAAFSDDCKLSDCESDETCCPTGTPGVYSCCPSPNAVCCGGHTFCCPKGTKCELSEGKCIPEETSGGNRLEKRQGPLDEESQKIACPDGSLCPDGNTCCIVTENKYGCCPHPQGICCPDGIHCCAHDQLCDVTSRYCVGKRTVSKSAVKEPALPVDFEDSA